MLRSWLWCLPFDAEQVAAASLLSFVEVGVYRAPLDPNQKHHRQIEYLGAFPAPFYPAHKTLDTLLPDFLVEAF